MFFLFYYEYMHTLFKPRKDHEGLSEGFDKPYRHKGSRKVRRLNMKKPLILLLTQDPLPPPLHS